MAWDQTKNQIIRRSLRILGVIAQGDTLSAEQLAEGSDALNGLLKSLGEESIFLYKIEWNQKILSANSEIAGSDALNYTCIRTHVSAVAATKYPITGDQWQMYWKQEGSAGVAWAVDTRYNTLKNVVLSSDVLHILKGFIRDNSGIDHPLKLISRGEYAALWDKNQGATYPYAAWFNKQENVLYLYLLPSAANSYILHFQAQYPIDDLLLPDANPDAPVSYYDMICYNLAANLADEYVIPLNERQWISQKAEVLKQRVKGNNTEDTKHNAKEGAY